MKRNINPETLDFSPVIGLAGLVLFFGGTLYWEDSFSALVYLPTLCIILGCSLSVLLICFSLKQVSLACGSAFKSLFILPSNEKNIALSIVQASQIVHTSSLLSLQKSYLKEYKIIPFWRDGLNLLTDGTTIEQTHQIMHNRMAFTYNRLNNDACVFEKLSNATLAIGIIVALIILMSLNAVDFVYILLPVLYSMMLSFIIYRPLSTRIRQFAQMNASNEKLCLIGLKAIDSAQNPHKTQDELNAVLSPFQRINFFEE